MKKVPYYTERSAVIFRSDSSKDGLPIIHNADTDGGIAKIQPFDFQCPIWV